MELPDVAAGDVVERELDTLMDGVAELDDRRRTGRVRSGPAEEGDERDSRFVVDADELGRGRGVETVPDVGRTADRVTDDGFADDARHREVSSGRMNSAARDDCLRLRDSGIRDPDQDHHAEQHYYDTFHRGLLVRDVQRLELLRVDVVRRTTAHTELGPEVDLRLPCRDLHDGVMVNGFERLSRAAGL